MRCGNLDFSKEKVDFFFTTKAIPLKFGGLTTAMFRRAHVFSKGFDNKVNILTFQYQPNLYKINKRLRQEGYTNDSVLVRNMYDYLSEYNLTDFMGKFNKERELITNIEKGYEELDYDEIKITKDNRGIITKTESVLNGNTNQIKEFNSNGILLRIRNYQLGTLYEEIFYREDQSQYMIKKFQATQESKVEVIYLLSQDRNVVKGFKNHKELQMFWLELLINTKKATYLINDNRPMDNLILSFNKKKTQKIFVIHSTHLRAPYQTYSTVRTGNRQLFEDIGSADGIVLLTDRQKGEIQERFGYRPTLSVIPHYIENGLQTDIGRKSRNRFVVISRFHEEKQLDHIIKAFNFVKKSNLDFQLDIYGDGKEKKTLNSLIHELHLEDKVKIHSFTSNPDLEFSKSIGSFLTSKYEGFGLTILESLKNRCPVFSYDIKYGPSDMIIDGYNGYLIKPNNIKELAEKIKTYIKLPQTDKEKMFTNATDSTKNFSEEMFVERWSDMLKGAMNNSGFRYEIAKKEHVTNTVDEIQFNKKGLLLSITTRSIEESYRKMEKDVKGITIEINKKQWAMERKWNQSDQSFVFHASIPFKELKSHLNYQEKYPIYYYFNLDNIKYCNRLKFKLDQSDNKKHTRSFRRDMFQLIYDQKGLKLLKRKKHRLKWIFDYLK